MFISKGELESLRIGRAMNDAGLRRVESLLSDLFTRMNTIEQKPPSQAQWDELSDIVQGLLSFQRRVECSHDRESVIVEWAVGRGCAGALIYTCRHCHRNRIVQVKDISRKDQEALVRANIIPAIWLNVKNKPYKETK